MEDDRFLIVVNYNNKFSKDMLNNFNYVTTTDSYGKTMIVAEAYDAFTKLKKTMIEKHGIVITATSIFRTPETQKAMYDEVKAEKGEEYANRIVAKPNESEHLLGLAIDVDVRKIYTPIDRIVYKSTLLTRMIKKLFRISYETKSEMYKALHSELSDYGFILRYSKDKADITGVQAYEPWHIRFVGVENAKAIEKMGMCLEEYVECIKTQKSTQNRFSKDKRNANFN